MPTSQVGFKSSGQGSISEQPVQKKTSSQNQTIFPCLFFTSKNFRTMHVYFVFFHNVFNTQIVKSSYKIIKKPQKINENKLPMLHPRYTFSVDEPFCAFWKDVHT